MNRGESEHGEKNENRSRRRSDCYEQRQRIIFYKSRNGDLILDLDEFGDEEYVTFGDLKR